MTISNQTSHKINLKHHSNSPTNTSNIIKLTKSQRYQHPELLQTTPQTYQRYFSPKHIIQGPYQTFLQEFNSDTNNAIPHRDPDLLDRFDEQTTKTLRTILNQFSINHSESDQSQQHTTYFIIQNILYNINQCLEQIEADQHKTAGAAVRRRSKAITQYKTNISNFNLLQTSIRQAISSTMRTRSHLQNTTEDQIKYIETKTIKNNKITYSFIPYESKIFSADFNAITTVLNPDLYFLYQNYKLTTKILPKINSLITKYNTLLIDTDTNSLRRSLQISNN